MMRKAWVRRNRAEEVRLEQGRSGAGAELWQEQGRSGAEQEQARSSSRARAGQEQDMSRPGSVQEYARSRAGAG